MSWFVIRRKGTKNILFVHGFSRKLQREQGFDGVDHVSALFSEQQDAYGATVPFFHSKDDLPASSARRDGGFQESPVGVCRNGQFFHAFLRVACVGVE